MRIVFVHGWGLAPDFWEGLAALLSEHECGFINLGFLGQGEDLSTAPPALYITHSLGTLWALKNCNADMQGLVAINGFTSFRRFASKENLADMRNSLQQNPAAHMAEFWEILGVEASSQNLNVDKLTEGLDWLMRWNEAAQLKSLSCPILSLAGAQDNILPLPQMQKEWAGRDMRVCEGGGHILPQTHSDWCAQQIRDILS